MIGGVAITVTGCRRRLLLRGRDITGRGITSPVNGKLTSSLCSYGISPSLASANSSADDASFASGDFSDRDAIRRSSATSASLTDARLSFYLAHIYAVMKIMMAI